jgi:CRP-like cAMP-binding protein
VTHNQSQWLRLSRQLLRDLAESDPSLWTVLWEFYHERLLANLLGESSLFRPLSRPERNALSKEFRYGQVSSGSVIIRQGEPGEGLYLVLSGEVQVSHASGEETHVVARLRDGDFFGTVSSATNSPAAATVAASLPTTLLFLPRQKLQALVATHPAVEQALQRLVGYRQIVVGKTGYSSFGITE